jgi:hypothetical protein
MTDEENEPPCCANDALRRVKIIRVNGVPTGLAMLEKVFDEVRDMDIRDDTRLKEILLEKVKVSNYIPKDTGDAYAEALVKENRTGMSGCNGGESW